MDLGQLSILNAQDYPLTSVSRVINHQLAICITNKALLIFAELHKLFVIKLLVDSYVVHSLIFSLIVAAVSQLFCVSVIVLLSRNLDLYSVIE